MAQIPVLTFLSVTNKVLLSPGIWDGVDEKKCNTCTENMQTFDWLGKWAQILHWRRICHIPIKHSNIVEHRK